MITKFDTIDVKHSTKTTPEGEYDYIDLYLNGEMVKGVFDAIIFAVTLHRKRSLVEILTCSCGVSGCAGIFEGTRIKVRKKTVEWRDIDCGLPKKFYTFRVEDYLSAVEKTVSLMKDIALKRERVGYSRDNLEYRYEDILGFDNPSELEEGIKHAVYYFTTFNPAW